MTTSSLATFFPTVRSSRTASNVVVTTFRISTRNMTDGLVEVILTGFRDGVVATRIHAATVQPARLAGHLAEMLASLQAKGLLDEDTLAAAHRPRPIIAFA
ncbi:MAG: hypothetical protein ACRYGP_17590 [Janthinobacterium lividum]